MRIYRGADLCIQRGEGVVTKTLIDIDDTLLEAAREALGTSTKKDTVNAALREVIAMQRRSRAAEDLVDWLSRHEPLDREARLRAWRQSP